MGNRASTSRIATRSPRSAWRGWAGPLQAAIGDADLATALDRRDDLECGFRTPGRWRRRRW
jgi:hypothetical protein